MQFETTTKLFYGKFPYKAVMTHEAFDVDEYYGNMTKMLKWLKSLPKDDYQMRHAKTIQLFFRKRKDLEYVVNSFHKWVTQVYEPFNKKHYEYLMQNKDCITRNRLFWNKYSYKITLGAHTNIEKAVAWFENFFTERDPIDTDMGTRPNLREKETWRLIGAIVLYSTEHDDVMLCKLAPDHNKDRIQLRLTCLRRRNE